tara:strand:+ start:234 stop:413 length:180 start_codon:yes stop_codon:yes gene_type:complete
MPNKWLISHEHEPDKNPARRPVIVSELTCTVDAADVGEAILEPTGDDGIVLRLAVLLIK